MTPTLLKRVDYKVAGEYAYRGDLIVTDRAFYYFPHTDLIERTNLVKALSILSRPMGPLWGLVWAAMAPVFRVRMLEAESTKRLSSLMLTSGSDNKKLSSQVESYITELKKDSQGRMSSVSMPLPIRFDRYEAANVSVSLLGTLRFNASYENHVFNVGLLKLRQVELRLSPKLEVEISAVRGDIEQVQLRLSFIEKALTTRL